ncbi:MAG: ABC-F family ATP-binding cassette domain-containing protein [Bacteroidales bacterium]|nr:ABC-F family ATP-binding cassette domain-containing protein [Bacteroidales bacterium]
MIPYLQVEDLTKSFGDLVLFEGIKFTIGQDQRVGIIARNGAGKTTLLRICAGQDTADSGNIIFRNDLHIGYLEQEPTLIETASVLENIFSSNDRVANAIRTYEKALLGNDKVVLQHSMEEMDRLNAWDHEVKARQILSKLKLEDINKPVSQLSGGQRKRVALASTLINKPDILILDEPTNHLDLDMVEWLEDYLLKNRFTILMVTHDRFFLDRVCTDIIEFDQKQLYWYKGNYKYFLEKRQERISYQNAEVEKATNLLRKESEWMGRMPQARGTKAKYRIDAFYQLQDKASQRRNDSEVEINVKSSRLGNKVLEIKSISKRFDETIILKDFSYTFNRSEKLGIIGRNGTGKSTFLNIITGSIPPDSGTVDPGETVVFGYYRQDGMKIRDDQKVIDVAREIAEVVTLGDGKTLTASQFLNLFLFSPETQYSFVQKLSGGEKRRLYLLTILMRNPNFLILDEPTNDLDILTLNVLEEYLQNFSGVVIVVSHDRHFMDKVVNGLLVFDGDGEVSGFPGSYSDYREWAKENEENQAKEVKLKTQPKPERVKPEQEKVRKLTFNEKRELDTITKEIEELEKEKSSLELEISSGSLPHDDLLRKSSRYSELLKLIDKKSERWFELTEIMEG